MGEVITLTIGEQLRMARKSAHLTQKELGDKLGVSYQMIAQYENNRRRPKIDTLRKICSAMGITISDLGGDIWKYYSAEDFAEDLKNSITETLSILPKQMEDSIKQGQKETSTKLKNMSEQAQQHAHEIVDSDWKCLFLLHDFEKLNAEGRSEAQKRVNELTEIKKYTEPEEE